MSSGGDATMGEANAGPSAAAALSAIEAALLKAGIHSEASVADALQTLRGVVTPSAAVAPATTPEEPQAVAKPASTNKATDKMRVKAFGGFYDPNDATAVLEDVSGVECTSMPPRFGEAVASEYCHAVGDLVWVKMRGFPNWPAEILSAEDPAAETVQGRSKKNTIPCRLFHPPGGIESPVVWTCGKNIAYFDRLYTEGELARCKTYRLMADQYDVKAYKDAFDLAIRVANTHARAVLTPEAMSWFKVTPLGVAYTYFRAHYQAPRQPSANEQVKKETGVIVLRDGLENLLRDLNKFDRIWVLFQFSYSVETQRTKKQSKEGHSRSDEEAEFFSGWKSMIVPPRDKKQRGLLATRSPHRPNGIGLSCCRLLNVSGKVLTIRDHDLLHGTPILDIKPYLPFCDSHPEANHGWVDDLDEPGPDHRWNEQEYAVHRRVPVEKGSLTTHG
eukprot:TRINITY_DN32276_c0_g1_i1.p1 TRINITY_DN32276_c0_g1~~TRINITY_DN32276_c0_g1_i1.p1  ORF type:complete len:446 (+),score=170.87 TRINITY_DN32276_c0_g1_i1:78-1415(+)